MHGGGSVSVCGASTTWTSPPLRVWVGGVTGTAVVADIYHFIPMACFLKPPLSHGSSKQRWRW